MKNLFYLCVEGSVNSTYSYLKNLKNKSEAQAKIEKHYYNRFFKENPDYFFIHDDTWIENIINTYRHYFVKVLTDQVKISVAEAELFENLNLLLPSNNKGSNMENTEEKLKTIFEEKGYFFMGGRVPPHYGPFIWKTTNKKKYPINIFDSTEEVQVCFLDDFLLLSWLHFATFGEVYAGGWAEKNALYCITPNYRDKFDTDAFLVSFLKHEAQHFNDYKRFPKLTGADLEYRAKLVELYYYSSYEFLEKLLVQAINNANPHNYSAFIILNRLSKHFFNLDQEKTIERWYEINYEDIRHFAKELFDEHTVMLHAHDAHRIEGII